jgi:formylglycine-generating enzyme required for sulfatase activity
MKRYENFDLTIERAARGGFAARVGSHAGEARAAIRPAAIAALERRLQAMAKAETLEAARRAAREFGEELYRTVFAGEIASGFQACHQHAAARGEGVRLRLRLGGVPQLARWPWELLARPGLGRFLALSTETPIVRYAEVPEPVRPVLTALPLTILVAIAAPLGQSRLDTDREWGRIEAALAPLVGRVVLERLQPATLAELGRRLTRGAVHVLHFIGHGSFDRERQEGVLLFEDERGRQSPVSGERLGAALFGRQVRLAVLNACEGACHGESDAFGGVAQSLMRQRIPAVIAMQREITDRAAATFAERFYETLARGEPVDAAVAEARLAMDQKGHGIEWGAPVLYLRAPDGILFDLGSAAPRRRLLAVGLAVVLLVAGLALLVRSGRQTAGTGSTGRSLKAQVGKKADAPSNTVPPISALAPAPERVPAQPRRPAVAPPAVPHPLSCPSPHSLEIGFVRIERGSFLMGSAHGDKNERPPHMVTITRPFCMGAYEVTVGQWDEVMGNGAPAARNDWLMPKVDVSWDDVHEFLRRLNAQNPGRRFFLPSEAQWEYAARAGSALLYGFADVPDELYKHANCQSKGEHSDGYDDAAPAGSFPANAWKLSDMQGNVWEWVEDRSGDYDAAPAVDPQGPAEGEIRVRRGGSFRSKAEHCRPSTRSSSLANQRLYNLGFRIAAEPIQ